MTVFRPRPCEVNWARKAPPRLRIAAEAIASVIIAKYWGVIIGIGATVEQKFQGIRAKMMRKLQSMRSNLSPSKHMAAIAVYVQSMAPYKGQI